jgi:hypothetical protein
VASYANPQSLNRFAYVLNNPLRYVDPTGHYNCTSETDCGSDISTQKNIYANSIKKEFKWKLKGRWSLKELEVIYQVGSDIQSYVDSLTSGKGKEWMLHALGFTTIEHGDNKDQHSYTWPQFPLGNAKITLGRGWLVGWDARQLLAHELGHVWDLNRSMTTSFALNRAVGGWGGLCSLCDIGSGVPRWDKSVHYSQGDAYGNSGINEYFAEAFSLTIYDRANTPNGVAPWIDTKIASEASW